MRVSEYFSLGRTQPTLDFVDVDVRGDVAVFVDPTALRVTESDWAKDCTALIQDFFSVVLSHITSGDRDAAIRLLASLTEPNEVHLGLSSGHASGRAIGLDFAEDIVEAIELSAATRSGLLRDIEDTALMIEGIGPDRVSDMVVNVIRGPLVQYTQRACGYYGIPMDAEVDSGPIWSTKEKKWFSELVPLPTVGGARLLLVPKAIVRQRFTYQVDEYYRHYLLSKLQDEEIAANSELVHLLKDGTPRVYKTDLEEKYGRGKLTVVEQTVRHPDVLDQYRYAKLGEVQEPLSHFELAIAEDRDDAQPDWDTLLNAVTSLAAGRDTATQYEDTVEALLSAIFYPALTNPEKQVMIHGGRKIIDITFDNIAKRGFFGWVSQHYPAPKIYVECKNYTREVANEELDQLAGRFSPRRGQVGILVARQFSDKGRFIQRCRDTADDGRGFIIPLDDQDLENLVAACRPGGSGTNFPLLRDRFDRLIL